MESGRVPNDALIVTRTLRKSVAEYKASVAHRSAAIQLLAIGKDVEAGDSVGFVHSNAEHSNPLCRVALPGRSDQYDRRTYRRLVEEAAKAVFNAAGAELFPKVDPLQASLC